MGFVADMTGRAALVTGAASGLGRAASLKLAAAGANVAVVDINREGLEETAAMIRELGVEALAQVLDISQADNCAAAVAATVEAFGRLDALSNVAGIIFLCNAREMPVAHWQKIVDVNLSGPFYLIQAAIPHLLEADGAVVNVTSSAAFIGEAYAAAYCATKAGLNNLTRALAMEFTHKPIRFNAVAPGGMVTTIANAISLPEDADYELMRRYTGLRGTVELEDVADIILMLASDAGRGFHGACISIDKGITAG